MFSKWLQDFDRSSLSKPPPFNPLADFELISQDIPVFFNYLFLQDALFSAIQRKILDFIQIFQRAFDELSSFPDDTSQEFAKLGLLTLQCERFYCQEGWRQGIAQNTSIFPQLVASFLRIKRLFYSLHKNLCKSDSSKFCNFILWRNLQSAFLEAIDPLINSLKAQGMLKKQMEFDFTNLLESLRSFKHYIEHFQKKTHDYLLQETLNLFGEQCERALLSIVLSKDQLGILYPPSQRPSNSGLISLPGLDNSMKESLFAGFSAFFKRESNFHELSELRLTENEESPHKKQLSSVFEGKLLENYPCLNERMNENMEKILCELRSLGQRLRENSENMVRSVKNSRDLFENDGKLSENASKSVSRNESLEEIAIKSDNEDAFRKISDLDSKIEEIKKKGEKKLRKPLKNNNKMLISHSFQAEDEKTGKMDSSGGTFLRNQGSLLFPPPQKTLFSKKSKTKRKQEKFLTNILSPRLNISAQDLIKIDSNTKIIEELRHVEFVESDNGVGVRDSELFPFEPILARKDENEGFLAFLERERGKEMGRKDGVYFRFLARKGNFIRKIQIHQEVQAILRKAAGEKGYLERKERRKIGVEPEWGRDLG